MEERKNNTNVNAISEKTLNIITIIQAIMLSSYGMCAILLHRRMMTYDIYSISDSGSPVHICYLATLIAGLFLIIYRLIKDRSNPGFFRSAGFLTPVIAAATALIFSQANTVYTSTRGGSLFGMIGYIFKAGFSGSDPIDSFVYGSMTIPKYVFVVIIGIGCAAFTILNAGGKQLSAASLEDIKTDAIREKAAAAASAGSSYIGRATAIASAAATAARQAAKDTAPAETSVDKVNIIEPEEVPVTDCQPEQGEGPDDSDKTEAGKVSSVRKVVIPMLLVLLAAGSIAVYTEFFSMTKYDLRDYTTDVTINGYDGEAVAYPPSVDHSKLDSLEYEQAYHLSDVLSTVEFRVTPAENLSNGDKIKVEAVYDEDFAKRYNIKLTNLSDEVEVKGAVTRVTSKDITPDTLAAAVTRGSAKIKEELEYYDAENIACEHIGSFFLSAEEMEYWSGKYDDELALVYKVTFDEPAWDTDEETIHETAYYIVKADYLMDASDVDSWNMTASGYFNENAQETITHITSMDGDGYEVVELK